MATTVSAIQTKVNQFIRDSGTNSVSAAERLAAISMAVQETITEIGLDHMQATYTLNYLDTVYSYDITTAVPGFLEPIDLRREEVYQDYPFVRKNARELWVEIGEGSEERAFAVEIRDEKIYLIVNHTSRFPSVTLHSCDDHDSNGTWTADTTNSDATNVTTDTVEYRVGTGSVNFDADVSQSGNDRATIYNEDMTAVDLSDYVDIGSLVFWVYIPETTEFSSITAYWGSSSSAYWSATVTTDYQGAAFVEGSWNRIKVNWADATMTSTPDSSEIDYLRFDFNYTASYVDDTDFRIDDIKMIRPEKLTLHYESKYIGENSSGTKLLAFTATTDVPFYSGLYDYLDNPVARRAAGILFEQVGSLNDAASQNAQYMKMLRDVRKRFPHSTLKETQNFKVKGLNFRKRKR